MRIEDLDCFKDIPIDEIDENELIDINYVDVRMDLPPKERLKYTLDQVENLYFDKCEVFSCQVHRFYKISLQFLTIYDIMH